jgi:hypothetical protein
MRMNRILVLIQKGIAFVVAATINNNSEYLLLSILTKKIFHRYLKTMKSKQESVAPKGHLI